MPRTKRVLVESGPDAEVSVSKNSSKGKEASSTETATAKKAESSASNARNENVASDSNPELASVEPVVSENAGSASATAAAAEPLKFVALSRPYWDIEAERYDKSGEEDDEDEDEDEEEETSETADMNSPEWPWIISEEGLKKYKQLEKQASNRDQDGHGMNIYNDFTAYGVQEVVDNWLNDFNKEASRRTVSPDAVWAQLEGFALFSQLDYIDTWFQGDDCDGFCQTISTIGKALLTGLHILKNHQLLKPYHPENGSRFKNISTVLALFVQFVGSWTSIGGDHHGETKWVATLVELAKENSIDIEGPYNFPDTHAQELLEIDPEDIDDDVEDEYVKYSGDYSIKGWKEAFKAYAKGRRIGSAHYDLSKMSKAEKKKYMMGGGAWRW